MSQVKTAVFIPTYRPGIDITIASLARQKIKPNVILIGDELGRHSLWYEHLKSDADLVEIGSNFIKPGNKRGLCRAYNDAAYLAIEDKCDLLISLQDYIYIESDGIERFVKLHELYPNDLLTGITDISADPYSIKVKDLNDPYTIFDKPYTDKPKIINWKDPRDGEIYNFAEDEEFKVISPEHWEANWAAVPVSLLKEGLRWDERYDQGIAYENQDVAQKAFKDYGARTILDRNNRAISLPHKRYWKNEEQEIIDYSNRALYESIWYV